MKKYYGITGICLIIFVIILFGFYWYSFRQAKIISNCSQESLEKSVEKRKNNGEDDGKFNTDDREVYYKWCLREKGLLQ